MLPPLYFVSFKNRHVTIKRVLTVLHNRNFIEVFIIKKALKNYSDNFAACKTRIQGFKQRSFNFIKHNRFRYLISVVKITVKCRSGNACIAAYFRNCNIGGLFLFYKLFIFFDYSVFRFRKSPPPFLSIIA